jgi:hypothetical protein
MFHAKKVSTDRQQSVGACLIIAGMAVYTAHIMRRYASKAQQVVLAMAIFDKQGRILVNPDGLIPTEKITDTFLEKNGSDTFSTAHPLFHWMFQASRNWQGISTLVGGMTNHLAHLPHSGRDRDARTGIKLINEHGELIDNYDRIFRELFCVAAVALAEKMKEHLSSVGILWDEILATGAGGERPGAEIQRRQQEIDDILQGEGHSSKGGDTAKNSADMAEKGVYRRKQHEYGRGSLMFLIRHVQNDREVDKLEAAGYRFAELHKVSGIIGSSMQVKTRDFETKLKDMANYAQEDSRLEPGVHLGLFGIRARVGTFGFDVLVRKGARNLLPSMQMPIDRLEGWQLDFLGQLDHLTAAAISRKLDGMKKLAPREMIFASQLFDTIQALRESIDDPLFDEAILTAKAFNLPAPIQEASGPITNTNTLIAFRLVIPIHATVVSQKCEFIPLNFFKVHQLVGKSSPNNSAFVRSVHRELAPILESVPVEKSRPGRNNSKRGASLRSNLMPNRFRRFGRPSDSYRIDSEGNPTPDSIGRAPSPSVSDQSESTLKLWPGGRRSSDPQSSADSRYDVLPAYQAPGGQQEQRTFAGIMVSQEITVNIHDAADVGTSPSNTPGQPHRRGPSLPPLLGTRASEANGKGSSAATEQNSTTVENGRTNASGGSAIEMQNLGSNALADVHTGADAQVILASVEVENTKDVTTFVDELFTVCIGSR